MTIEELRLKSEESERRVEEAKNKFLEDLFLEDNQPELLEQLINSAIEFGLYKQSLVIAITDQS